MYLVDTDVISEACKAEKAYPGARAFFEDAARENVPLYLSVITIGELRQGVGIVRHRGDELQARLLEQWLDRVTDRFEDAILSFDEETSHVWGRLRVPNHKNPLDEQIAATAMIKLAHHFGKPMAERGRGGILMIGSMAGNAGSYFLATYSAAKAYNQILMEALWAELQPRGVDVLAFPIGAADTPSRARSGTIDADEMPVARSEEVAQQALNQLPHGPVYVSPENVEYFKALSSMPRREAAELQRNLLTRMLRAPTRA
jgi:NAD(P)-dependent dehydrogenase (short-subunit alcohol dehydrogenase family)